jgi:hypothetical protein
MLALNSAINAVTNANIELTIGLRADRIDIQSSSAFQVLARKSGLRG